MHKKAQYNLVDGESDGSLEGPFVGGLDVALEGAPETSL